MPNEITFSLSGDIAQANYLAGRLMSGCDALKQNGGWDSYEEAWINGVEFGEWNPQNQAEAMPKVVVSNAQFTGIDRGETGGNSIPSGSIAVIVYIKADRELGSESERELAAYSFFGELVAEIYSQSGDLLNPGEQFSDRTLFINQIDLLGPTRTMEKDRGADFENDYFDAVLMIEWGREA